MRMHMFEINVGKTRQAGTGLGAPVAMHRRQLYHADNEQNSRGTRTRPAGPVVHHTPSLKLHSHPQQPGTSPFWTVTWRLLSGHYDGSCWPLAYALWSLRSQACGTAHMEACSAHTATCDPVPRIAEAEAGAESSVTAAAPRSSSCGLP